MKRYPISVVIPVYKNYDMFFRNLSKNGPYLEGCEVIVMNDYPKEKIANRVKKIFPQAKISDNRKNFGFAGNINAGVGKATRNYIFMMNSDVILKDDGFKKSLDYFKKDHKLFAVSFAQYESDGKLVGANRGYFKNGMVNHARKLFPKSYSSTPIPNFWAEGGSAIFKKKIFTKIGLLDTLYSPFYWEDIDLSYRAWKAGYRIVYAPTIKVQHYHESTIGKYFDKSSVLVTVYRNQFTFQWKNLTDGDFLISHILSLPKLILGSIIKGDRLLFKGFVKAVWRLPRIIKSRQKVTKLFIKSDRAILNQFK